MIEGIENSTEPGPKIWAIGGGKGGVGKSVIATNLAVSIAHSGVRVAIVDADLGGANLHTLLGVATPKLNLADFLARRVNNLQDVMTPTNTDNLWLVSGARALLEMANPNFGQKGKILRHIRALEADHVFLDLGAGSAFNVLDFFLVARRGIMVVVPEATSVENAYHFLKAAFYRKLRNAKPRDQIRAAIDEVMSKSPPGTVRTPRDLISQVLLVDPNAGASLVAEASMFSPSLIVNRVEQPDHERLGEDMGTACKDYFGISLHCLANLPWDRLVARSVSERRPAVELFQQSSFSVEVRKVAEQLVGRQHGGV